MRRVIFLLAVVLALTLDGQSAEAEVKTFHAESSYLMDRGEPIKDAQETAFNDAVKKISETAGVIVKSSGAMTDHELTESEIETITAAVLRIKSKTFGKKFTADGGLEISVDVDATVDTENVDKLLAELSTASNSAKSYEDVLKDYTERQSQFDTVYGEYLNSYQKRIKHTIRDGCKLQNDGKIDEALKLYDAAIAKATASDAEISVAYVNRGHVYNLQGKANLAKADFEKAIALNTDAVSIHYAKAVLLDARGDKAQAAQEYRTFVKDADIVYYDVEITEALNKIVELEEAS